MKVLQLKGNPSIRFEKTNEEKNFYSCISPDGESLTQDTINDLSDDGIVIYFGSNEVKSPFDASKYFRATLKSSSFAKLAIEQK